MGAYVPATIAGRLLFISGMLPRRQGDPAYTGRVGADISIEDGATACELAALNALAVAKDAAGSLDKLRVVRLAVHVACEPGFAAHSAVADGASDLFKAIFQERGVHARLVFGAVSLPGDMPVELECIFEIVD